MFTKSFAVAVALSASLASFTAQANPILDFAGVGNGADVLEFYNGGTDSMGNRGTNYGVSFSNAVAHYNFQGVYVAPKQQGYISMMFDPAVTGVGINFMADGRGLDTYSWAYVNGQRYEPTLIESGSYVPSYINATGKRADWFEGMMWAAKMNTDYIVDSILFNVAALDDIAFGSNKITSINKHNYDEIDFGRSNNAKNHGEVPLPGTAWLMVAGLFVLSLKRVRKSVA